MKTQQKKKTNKTKFIILSIFLSIVITLLIGCFYTLSKGIRIQHFKIANIELNGLYLKLDNKLILTLDTLAIKKQNKQTHFEFPKAIRWFQNSLVAISYFEKIEVKNIFLPQQKESASVFYDGKRYHLFFPEIQALFQIQQDSHKINLKIQKFIATNFQVQLNGEIDYFLSKDKLAFSLIAHPYGDSQNRQEKLIIKGNSNLKILNVSAFSTPIKSLALYEKDFAKIPALHTWLLQKASFDSARIKNLFFSAPLNEDFIPKMLKSLYAELDFENVGLKLESHLAPITTPFLKAKFQNEILSFSLKDPRYEGLQLDGSFVELHNLSHPSEGVKTLVFLKSSDAVLDQRIHKILQTYGIGFDVKQLDSVIDLNLKLSFQKIQDELNVQAQGTFLSQNTHLEVFGMPVFAQSLNLTLDLTPNGRHLFINDSQVTLENPLIEGLVSGDINLADKTIQGRLKPNIIHIQTSPHPNSPLEKILFLEQDDIAEIAINADFAEVPSINLPDFSIMLTLGESKTIVLEDLSKLYPYSPLLSHLAIKNGKASIQTTDFKNFSIQSELFDLTYPIFDKKWNPIKEFHSNLQISPTSISLQSLDESVTLQYHDNLLKVFLKDKNFDFQALRHNTIPLFQSSTQEETKPSSSTQKSFSLYLESKNSAIKYKELTIPTDEIIVNMNNKKTTIDATHKNGVINVDLYDDIAKFQANNFSGDFINLVAGKEIVQGGLFGIKGLYKNKILRADMEIQNTTFKNFATLQNIVALIDTIPSLIVFKKPGFSTDGYQVKHGRILMELNDKYLGLKKIDLVGDTIDINGGGIVTLDTQELNISLTISTIKGLSEVLNKIPIVGYLLLGKEGKISTSLILKGTLQNPKSEVTLAEDIISAPFKIIERIFISD
ncbi:AsmA-like C-terminal domain-containing protein [Helicobacter kayseriensis]|uniref:YhdP family protein n=1 Tax=Helicobacter kayseriensis TaxID=2905877 RepID=UPI001E5DC16F|nr:AsmA-like C-terminal domain-containing protein [Helicobacter kayseriensis]MCE3047430.1 AsmA-like C-terminal domain-containing protein [Helicobacter kayseriensis]MCE3048899.1 AsmA-like C-terminal domain-containing protein [Helicobacter kayseriensis]